MVAVNAVDTQSLKPIHLLSLNCWGLKYISALRSPRLRAIGEAIANASPRPDVVALQECWTQSDFKAICHQTSDFLPHAKFYYSGVFGSGLAILSRFEIVGSSMFAYPLNGRPTAFFRGDWYVGKGVACARLLVPHPAELQGTTAGSSSIIEIFNTHLHAPYEPPGRDSYLCHRTAQAWEMAKLLRDSCERGHLTIALGDFNMVPGSLAHRIILAHGGVVDAWLEAHPESLDGADESKIAGTEDINLQHKELRTVKTNIEKYGTTCDSDANTWRWSAQRRKARATTSFKDDLDSPDPRAQRLDYIFVGRPDGSTPWYVSKASVGMTHRHPTLHCSLSDHFSVEATLSPGAKSASASAADMQGSRTQPLASQDYAAVLSLVKAYVKREQRQRMLRLTHFAVSCHLTSTCLIGVWWVPHNYVSFILILVSSLNLAAGVIDGLIGGLFMSWELNTLKEFEGEVKVSAERRLRAE